MSNIQFEEKTYNTDSLDLSLWKRVFRLLGRQKKYFIRMGLIMSFLAVLDSFRPVLNKYAIDYFALGNVNKTELIIYGSLYLAYIVLSSLMTYLFTRQSAHIESGFMYDVRKDLFHKVQELSYSYYDKTPTGWVTSRILSDVGRLSEIVAWSFLDFVWGIGVMLLSSVVMLLVNWKMALMILLAMPLLAFISLWFQIRILKNYRAVRKVNSQITNSFSEGIAGAKTTKTLVLEESNLKEFKALSAEYHQKSYKAACFSSTFMPIVIGITNISIAFIIWYGGNNVLLQTIQFGTLMMFVEYAGHFFEPLRNIAGILAELQMAQAAAERVMSLIDEPVDITDSAKVIEEYGTVFAGKKENYPPIKGDVEFRHVDFYYNENEPLLKDFNLKVKAGQTIALVGETGAGKSTIVNLLCRFYEPVNGEILIDGVDYRQRSLGWLHSNLGYVLQTPTLFSSSIADNIRYGKLDATDEEVVEAAKLVSADEFINKLDKGYDSNVGEGGSKLSTGEKQLVSFARALVGKPPLVVLDEATSSVDTETEQKIQKAIETLLKDRTSFVVAHRLSTIINADRILVIENGRIIEQGRHNDLMKKKGKYYRLYINQFNQQLQDQLLGNKAENSIE